MTGWFSVALDVLQRCETAAMITVADVSGSAPREAGARMIVAPDFQWGTIGGGNLEYHAVKRACDLLAENDLDCFVDDYPLGPQLGQCCGGYVRLLTSRLAQSDQEWLEGLEGLWASGRPARFEIKLEQRCHAHYSVISGGATESGGGAGFVSSIGGALPPGDEPEVIMETVTPPGAAVYLFGAGHVGQAVARALAPLPVQAVWIDSREGYAPAAVPENTVFRCTEQLAEEAARARAGAFFLVFTHSHELDYQVVKAVLRRGDYRYCGLIGSRTKRASFERRLREEGVPEDSIGRLICPIGMPVLKSKDPHIIAVGVVAELLTYIETAGGDR